MKTATFSILLILINIIWAVFSFGSFFSSSYATYITLIIGFALYILSIIIQIVLLIVAIKKKSDRIPVYISGLAAAVVLTICNLPIASYGNMLSPTFGAKISFNEKTWKNPWHKNLRYYMADYLARRLEKEQPSMEEVVRLLGEPMAKSEDKLEYFLRPESFLVGIAYTSLTVEFKNSRVDKAYVAHAD
jgi:hypothetical protein